MCNSYRVKQKRAEGSDLGAVVSKIATRLASSLVCKSDPGVVVCADGRVEIMRWGFQRSFNPSINNARSDKLGSAMWSDAYRDRRCVIPVSLTPATTLLDLHFSLRAMRKVHAGSYIKFDGQDYEIAPTSRKVVTLLFHPFRKLWVLDHSPKLTWPPILGYFTL